MLWWFERFEFRSSTMNWKLKRISIPTLNLVVPSVIHVSYTNHYFSEYLWTSDPGDMIRVCSFFRTNADFDESFLFCLACSISVYILKKSTDVSRIDLSHCCSRARHYSWCFSANYTRMQYVIKYDSFTQKTASFSISSSSSYCTFSLLLSSDVFCCQVKYDFSAHSFRRHGGKKSKVLTWKQQPSS